MQARASSEIFSNGGYKMSDFNTVVKSPEIKWLSRYLNNNTKDWKFLLEAFNKNIKLCILLQSNCNTKELPLYVPDYYTDHIHFGYDMKESMTDLKLDWALINGAAPLQPSDHTERAREMGKMTCHVTLPYVRGLSKELHRIFSSKITGAAPSSNLATPSGSC